MHSLQIKLHPNKNKSLSLQVFLCDTLSVTEFENEQNQTRSQIPYFHQVPNTIWKILCQEKLCQVKQIILFLISTWQMS